MVDMYVVLVINKRRTIDQVPAQWRDLVKADLTAIGVDGYGDQL
ncbi:CD1375 family protein [Alkalihalophilus pseudofirmus]|nr:CD1375 family protein [Alkalihalophilus pseudofirmus]WEG18477.1 CD1375 family protein [Alkalihalophilus pseudofirmus]